MNKLGFVNGGGPRERHKKGPSVCEGRNYITSFYDKQAGILKMMRILDMVFRARKPGAIYGRAYKLAQLKFLKVKVFPAFWWALMQVISGNL